MNFDKFLKKIDEAKIVAITAPASADGDSVGTQCALKELFEEHFPDKKFRIVNEEPCPARYSFLPEAQNFEISADILNNEDSLTWPDAFICVDGSTSRIGDDTQKLWNASKIALQVDHHILGDGAKYDEKLYDPNAAATTEIVYRLIQHMDWNLSPSVAQAIYLGLIYDTGLFKHTNTKPHTLLIAAKLLETGFNHTETAEKGMLIRNQSAWDLMRAVLSSAETELEGRYCYGVVENPTLTELSIKAEDRDGVIDLLFLRDHCQVAAFYFEFAKGDWKVSFRSRGPDVASLARRLNPHGGGHKLASGCSLTGKKDEILAQCRAEIAKIIS